MNWGAVDARNCVIANFSANKFFEPNDAHSVFIVVDFSRLTVLLFVWERPNENSAISNIQPPIHTKVV